VRILAIYKTRIAAEVYIPGCW